MQIDLITMSMIVTVFVSLKPLNAHVTKLTLALALKTTDEIGVKIW